MERSVQELISCTASVAAAVSVPACPEHLGKEALGSGSPWCLGIMAALIAASLSVCSRYWSKAKFHHLWVYIASKMITDSDLSVLHSTSEISSLRKTQTSVCLQYRAPTHWVVDPRPRISACVSPGWAQLAPTEFS